MFVGRVFLGAHAFAWEARMGCVSLLFFALCVDSGEMMVTIDDKDEVEVADTHPNTTTHKHTNTHTVKTQTHTHTHT